MGDLTQQLLQTLVLTPNRRLSAWLNKHYQTLCMKRGDTFWETPRILPFDAWLHWHYQQAELPQILIDDFQSLQIWQEAITDSPFSESLLQPKQTAKVAQAAYKSLQQWKLSLNEKSFQEAPDTAAFQHLAMQYEKRLNAQGLVDSSQLFTILETQLMHKTTNITFLGFVEFTQAQQDFINACRKAGKTITIDPLKHTETPEIQRFSANDFASELQNIVQFCKTALAEKPNQRIGCIIPNLNHVRDTVESAFDAQLSKQFNISAGKPLAQYPIVDSALKLLQLNRQWLPLNNISHLLKTPFIANAEKELSQRMLLDAYLHQENREGLSHEGLQSCCAKQAPLLATSLAELIRKTDKISAYHWANHFNQLLQTLGWPGERGLNSMEYQAVKRFHAALDQFSALTFQQKTLSFDTAQSVLKQLCQQILFQPETKTQAIQILGSLEAAGLPFDTLWIAGLNSQDWPALTRPNPFIPLRLQREKGLPHATANRTLHFYQDLSNQLFHASPNVIVSYAKQADGIEYKPSPLIESLPEKQHLPALINATKSPASCEPYPNQGLALAKNTLRGGTSAFKSQAACPFQAYATFRLNAESIPETYFGLNAMDRGTITHKILELVWKKLVNKHALDEIEKTALQALIHNSIQSALSTYSLSNAIKALETTRLERLIYDWLQIEKTRHPFSIKALEQTQETVINGLNITTRADRVDTLSDGSSMVIDYKTKKVNATDWLKDRLPEPQLPIYALADQTVSAIAFGQVRRDALKLVDSQKLAWPEEKARWQTELNTLATELKAGHAAVQPRDPACCQQCDLHSLCRIHEETESC